MNFDDEHTAPMLPQKPLSIEELAPRGDRFSHSEALHYSHIVTDPKLYDAERAGTIKLAAAYIELTRQHQRLADKLEALLADPADIAVLQSTISHRAFYDTYPKTSAAIKRLLDKQVG